MSATICGHERGVLLRVLRNRLDAKMTRFSSLDEENADDDCHDPAKLAEIMAEVLRGLDVNAVALQCGTVPDPYPSAIVWYHADMLAIEVFPHHSGALTMPTARALLLQWLQLPAGTPIADVLRTLEGT